MKVKILVGDMLVDARIEMRDGGDTMVAIPVVPLVGDVTTTAVAGIQDERRDGE